MTTLKALSIVLFSTLLVQLPCAQSLVVHAPGWNFGKTGLEPFGQSATGYRLGVDPFELRNFRPSLTIAFEPGAKPGWRSIDQTIRANHYRSKRVRFSADVKTAGVQKSAGIWLRSDSAEGGNLTIGPERQLKGNGDWRHIEAVLDVPSNAKELGFGVLLVGSGQVWVSNMKFGPVGKDVRVSQVSRYENPRFFFSRRRNVVAKLPLEPTNLDLRSAG